MQWWNDLVNWLNSDNGWRVISTAVIPFVAIVVAGIVASLIGRGSSRRVIAMTERERRTATVAALISGARRAAKWNALSHPEQQHAEHLLHDADTRIRLLPLNGSGMVADWAAHEVNEMKRNSVSFSFQAEQSLMEFRNRLVEWQAKPGRAKKLFKSDLDTWAYEAAQADQDLVRKQQEWAKQQVEESGPAATSAPAEHFTPPEYALPQSVSKRETTAPVEDWTAPAPAVVAAETPAAAEEATAAPAEASPEPEPEPEPEAERATTDDADETPGPVSAGTVRQRTSPEESTY